MLYNDLGTYFLCWQLRRISSWTSLFSLFLCGLMLLKRKGKVYGWLNIPLFLISLAVIATFSDTFSHYINMSLDLGQTASLQRSFSKRACWDLASLEACILTERERSGYIWGGWRVGSFLCSIMREKDFQTVEAAQLLTMKTIKGIAISLHTRHTDWILAACHVTRDKSIFQWLW